jgi:tungstate transport system permease protein
MESQPPNLALALAMCVAAAWVAALLGIALALPLAMLRGPGRWVLAVPVTVVPWLPPVVLAILLLPLRLAAPGLIDPLLRPALLAAAAGVVSAPIVAVLALRVLAARWETYGRTLQSCGAGRLRCAWALLAMHPLGLAPAILAGFGRGMSEIGMVLPGTEPGLIGLFPGMLLIGVGVAFGASVLAFRRSASAPR